MKRKKNFSSRMTLVALFKTLCIFLFFPIDIYPTSGSPYLGPNIPEYHLVLHPYMDFSYKHHQHEIVTGYNRMFGVGFHFSRGNGFWKDFLKEEKTYESCLFKQANTYMKTGYHSLYTYPDLSSIKFQEKEFKYYYIDDTTETENVSIPYIEGKYYNTDQKQPILSSFRLYLIPAKEEDSTYFFYISIRNSSFFPEQREEILDSIFDMVQAIPRVKEEKSLH